MTARNPQSGFRWPARASALLLLVSLLLPFAQSAFAGTLGDAIMACCRRHKHECMDHMPMQADQHSTDASLSATLPQLSQSCNCPFGLAPSNHTTSLSHPAPAISQLPLQQTRLVLLAALPNTPQLYTPANPKRGPPTISIA